MEQITNILLAVDVGNTRTALGFFRDEHLLFRHHVATTVHKDADEYGMELLAKLRHEGILVSAITSAVLCCAVPPQIQKWISVCQRYLGVDPMVVRAGIRTGIRIMADNPSEVGGDRIANAVAALRLYGDPVIVVDLGTATVFDVVSHGSGYIGCVIAPGIESSAMGLFRKAAQFPYVELTPPTKAIGKNTSTALQSGIVTGHICLVEGLVTRVQSELQEKALVVATGTYCELIARKTPLIKAIQPDLTLTGLRMLYELNHR
ncbi:MAG: type III pantothenate kinase [Dehalococcoidales bacterium]|nr:type III pantothenate kinase [Dehalococcoidales bacterium]